MNTRFLMAAAVVTGLVAGYLIARGTDDSQTQSAKGAGAEREILYWVAPMDPNYRRDEPGKSPMGMDLVAVYADEVDAQPGVVSIDPVVVANLGVRSAVAERGSLPRRIETVGYVDYNQDFVQHVHTRVDGWVEKLAVKASGEPVTAGQLLFELYSPALVNAQQEYLAALRSGNDSLRAASGYRLSSLGMSDGDIARLEKERKVRQRVNVYSNSDGFVTHLGIREGMFVTPATEVMTVASLDTVWLLAEVFERQSAWVEVGQRATVELDYLPGRTWEGVVDYIYPELEQQTRTLRVRLRFDNAEGLLRPNMFASVVIEGTPVENVVHVPRQAVIRGERYNRVVIDIGDGRFRTRPVRLGLESGDRIAIRKGLSGGERVVTSAQFLIDSESNVGSALSRMEGDPR
jgi:Cu(I)/Ag(I) efflux system membrane fusion protein